MTRSAVTVACPYCDASVSSKLGGGSTGDSPDERPPLTGTTIRCRACEGRVELLYYPDSGSDDLPAEWSGEDR